MPEVVIDASALLALLNAESGADVVAEALQEGVISSVNLSEVIGKLCDAGMPEKVIHQALQPLGIKIIPFDEEQAYRAGLLRTSTQHLGISLGDRACLSLAMKLSRDVLTADRVWKELAIGIMIKVIR